VKMESDDTEDNLSPLTPRAAFFFGKSLWEVLNEPVTPTRHENTKPDFESQSPSLPALTTGLNTPTPLLEDAESSPLLLSPEQICKCYDKQHRKPCPIHEVRGHGEGVRKEVDNPEERHSKAGDPNVFSLSQQILGLEEYRLAGSSLKPVEFQPQTSSVAPRPLYSRFGPFSREALANEKVSVSSSIAIKHHASVPFLLDKSRLAATIPATRRGQS
jgi:hypothetical protein